jgi:hypothetical protein
MFSLTTILLALAAYFTVFFGIGAMFGTPSLAYAISRVTMMGAARHREPLSEVPRGSGLG